MRLTITVLIVVAFAACTAFVVLYATRSRGWWRTPVGRTLMEWPLVMALLLGLWMAGRFLGVLPLKVWMVGLAVLDVVLWRRVIILWRVQHDRRRAEREDAQR